MSLVDFKVVIDKEGNSQMESLEKSDQCYKLAELAKRAGKVVSQEEKDHVPVYHDVHQKGI